MKTRAILLILLLAGSCILKTYGQSTATQFNDQMAAITDSLFQKGTAWGAKVSEAMKGQRDFSIIVPARVSMENYIDAQIVKLGAMADVAGSYNYRQAVISYLKFEKGFAGGLIKGFEAFNAQTDTQTLQDAITRLTNGAAEEKKSLDAVSAAQATYAQANGFTVDKTKQ